MRKVYNILCGILIFAVMTVGIISLFDKDATYSEMEDKALSSLPKITISGLLDGSYADDLEIYYRETFPGREGLTEAFQGLERFYTFGGSPDRTK